MTFFRLRDFADTIAPMAHDRQSNSMLCSGLVFLICLAVVLIHMRDSLAKKRSDPVPAVTSWLPFIGSAFAFRREGVSFISRWSKKLGDPGVFKMHMMGKNMYVVTDPVAAGTVLSGRIRQLSWRMSKIKMIRNASGIFDASAVEILSECTNFHSMMEGHLVKAENLEGQMEQYQRLLHKDIIPSAISAYQHKKGDGWTQINGILSFFGTTMWMATVKVVFGLDSLANAENFNLSLDFDARFLALYNQTNKHKQKLLFSKQVQAREELVKRLMDILPVERGSERKFSGFTDGINKLYQGRIDHEDLARFHLLMLMASMFNAVPTTFWVIFHLLADPSAYDAVLKEVLHLKSKKRISKDQRSQSTGEKGDVDVDNEQQPLLALDDFDQMPALDSLITETLRLHSTNSMFRFRYVESDFDLKLPLGNMSKQFGVKKGDYAVVPVPLAHCDEDIFEDPMVFKWDRFIPDKSTGKPPIFRKRGVQLLRPVHAFGGGPTICPGRKYAVAEIKALVASMLTEYDMRFVEGKVPDPPSLLDNGYLVNFGMPADDVAFEISPRGK